MHVEIYDTTLRDGTQQEGISLTASDKLAVARLLDERGQLVALGQVKTHGLQPVRVFQEAP